jgi:carboxypeptidase Taq
LGKIFDRLRPGLVTLLEDIKNAPRRPDKSILTRSFPVKDQEAFAKEASAAIGFDYNKGRLDVVTHPFCTDIGPADVRITTRYDENFFSGAFFGVIHESGHGIYSQNLPAEHWGTPLGEAVSLGIHESQSRLWENMVARSKPYWQHWFPKARQRFDALKDVELEDFLFAINEVAPSFIRVEADEVTYNLHILLRFDLERRLVDGSLDCEDLPSAWNERFENDFGLKVPDDASGCLQDVHWSIGYLGYFPTYALGNLNAAQLMEPAREQIDGLDNHFRQGDYAPLRQWLTENFHAHGRRYLPEELIERVTGRPLDEIALLDYLKNKFYPLYGLSPSEE